MRSWSQNTGPTLDTKRRKLAVMMGTERGSRVLRREWDGARGFGVAMAEAMMLGVGEAEATVGIEAERSIWGTSASADLAGRSDSGGAQSGKEVNI